MYSVYSSASFGWLYTMEILPGWVNRSLVSLIRTLSILFLMISYRMLPAPSTSNFLSSARKLIEIGVLCARINCVVFIGWLSCLHNSWERREAFANVVNCHILILRRYSSSNFFLGASV